MRNVIRKLIEWVAHSIGEPTCQSDTTTQSGWFPTQAVLGANRFIPVAMVLVMVLGSGPVLAGTQAEALQQWCVGRDKWTAEGRKTDYPNPPEYFHFQHYCSALNAMNSLYAATSKKEMNYAVGLVMNNTRYIITHAPESNPLMTEVYALRGKAQAIAMHNASAETNLLKSLQLDPQNVGAYVTLANLYSDTKRRAKAEETVKTGLSVDSQNKALRRLAADLGIKVEALKPEAVVTEPVAAPTPKTEAAVMEPVPKSPKEESAPVDPTSTESSKIGSPTNPWCRFCPDPVVKP